MKKYIFWMLSVCLLTACDMVNSEGEASDNAVYMGNTNTSGVISMLVSDAEGGHAVVTPRLANITNEPVEVTVSVNEDLLKEYNQKAGLNLEPIAAEDFAMVTKDGKRTHGSATVVIEPGQFNASVELILPKIDSNKYPFSKRFAIPVSITNSSKYQILSSPKSTIIRLNRQLVTSVGLFKRGGSIALVPCDALREEMSNWTMQVSLLFPSLDKSNQTTMSIQCGTGDFYTRIRGDKGIQLKHGRDGEDTWTHKPIKTHKWVNLTYVHKNGSSVDVYINGELQKTFTTSPIYFSKQKKCCLFIGNTTYDGVYIREARMWKRALTEGEIIDKEYLPQDPADPDLIMYMPFTKTEDGLMKELTGNWEISDFRSLDIWDEDPAKISYVENVMFPAEDLVIQEQEDEEK
ncbi:LamG-like jellyroll fold domain-containing protein [Bacteroides pyogenes]|uniref:LamG-like jellyroll fold domain-containing protein n=1 Tax=Bacteroides pyogenes TaxID=310300 RepID=UPI0011E48F53|nr:LamG-like jellyroll fold domain-containing protein [Bacteroides pyogenes]TYK33660.1 DUF1735 domain-containing protein [Bacteroides pyogenes]TYK34551.1 DUF1735 domain-containing protein [Bacteroides pyogenes]